LLEHDIPTKLSYVNGYAIRYFDYNFNDSLREDSRTLILLHGIGASAERWLDVCPALSKHFRVVVPDIIGFGYSDKPTVEYTMDFFIEFFRGFLKNLNIRRPNIIGSSFGGHLATEYAIRYSNDTAKLVLAAPAGMMRTTSHVLDQYIMAALYPTYENVLRAFRNMAYDPNVVTEETVKDFINRMRLPNAKYAFMSTLLGIRDSPKLMDRLSKISASTLFIWGDNDNMIPIQYAKEYDKIIDSRIIVVKNCGHTPYIEKPLEFTEAILDFLAENAKG
jgi:2-hydroxy-6-oxonona-2,4-dienedioate hydrolase